MNKSPVALLLLIALAPACRMPCQPPPAKGAGKVLVGILDDAREEMIDWKPGVARERLIRLGFERTATGWTILPPTSIPDRITWTVAFDGKAIGEVNSEDPKLAANLGAVTTSYLTPVQIITTPFRRIPSVGKPSERFAPMGTGPTRGRRPLVVVSKANPVDPDGWKRINDLPAATAFIVRAAFRHEFPHVVRCKSEQIMVRSWGFPDSALSFSVVYESNKGTFLVQATLDAGDCGYVDDPSDPLSEPWFFVSADGQARHVGSFLNLLDVGDYDGDGRSELIFMLNQPEDTDGFILYDANLKEQARLVWTYH